MPNLVIHCLLISIASNIVHGDLCLHPDSTKLARALTPSAFPKISDTIVYTPKKNIDKFESCVLACCSDPSCNTAFFFNASCIAVQCHTPSDCEPGDSREEYKGATLVNLRTFEETKDSHTDSVTAAPAMSEAGEGSGLRVCSFGILEDCLPNQECVPRTNSPSKQGICACTTGYKMDPLTHSCEAIGGITDSVSPTTLTTTTPLTTIEMTPVVTAAPEMVNLVVSAGENKTVQYPQDFVQLSAFALPEPAKDEVYSYKWTLLNHPSGTAIGNMKGTDDKVLELSQLIPGVYQVKVDVSGVNKFGSAVVTVTVKPEVKANEPPTAVIKPSSLNISAGNVAILDGADSSDDAKILTYLWHIDSGPISEGFKLDGDQGSMLRLKDLSAGLYTIRLTVTDSSGLKSSATATVNVAKPADYPPRANAGDDVIVNLPKNSVTLYGNSSTDDNGIASYEWQPKSNNVNADIMMSEFNSSGVHGPVLQLSNLREGDYTFSLVVTDTAGQTSEADVHVYVKASTNKPPVAQVANNVTTVLPKSTAVLDGSLSTDDQLIAKYEWTQISGPSNAQLDNADRPKASASNLIKGDYVFQLTVYDALDMKDSTQVKVKVRDVANEAPKANAGGNRVIVLPIDMLTLDGTQSTDDSGIASYLWFKNDDSPGAGTIVNGSDTTALCHVVNLVAGRYVFSLTVADEEGITATDQMTLDVKPDPQQLNMLELSLDASIEGFTEKHKRNLATQLALMLPTLPASREVKVEIEGIHHDFHSGKLIIVFYVRDVFSTTEFTVRNGTRVKAELSEKLNTESELIGFKVAKIDTVVCQNDCSSHGHCDQFTKACVCDPFWMPNYLRLKWTNDSNCDWSILYVVVISLGTVLGLALVTWFCVCCSRRCKKNGRRKHTYRLLHDIDEMERDEKLAKRKNNIINKKESIFLSETDLSSEEDTLFSNDKKTSNDAAKDLLKKPKDFVKANNLRNQLKA